MINEDILSTMAYFLQNGYKNKTKGVTNKSSIDDIADTTKSIIYNLEKDKTNKDSFSKQTELEIRKADKDSALSAFKVDNLVKGFLKGCKTFNDTRDIGKENTNNNYQNYKGTLTIPSDCFKQIFDNGYKTAFFCTRGTTLNIGNKNVSVKGNDFVEIWKKGKTLSGNEKQNVADELEDLFAKQYNSKQNYGAKDAVFDNKTNNIRISLKSTKNNKYVSSSSENAKRNLYMDKGSSYNEIGYKWEKYSVDQETTVYIFRRLNSQEKMNIKYISSNENTGEKLRKEILKGTFTSSLANLLLNSLPKRVRNRKYAIKMYQDILDTKDRLFELWKVGTNDRQPYTNIDKTNKMYEKIISNMNLGKCKNPDLIKKILKENIKKILKEKFKGYDLKKVTDVPDKYFEGASGSGAGMYNIQPQYLEGESSVKTKYFNY